MMVACRLGSGQFRVVWFTLETLPPRSATRRSTASVARVISKICGCDLFVVDGIGMLPTGQDAAEAFYRIIEAVSERRSMAVMSSIPDPAM